MRCSLDFARVKEQQMQSLLSDRFRKSSLANRRSCRWRLWTWRRPSTECHMRFLWWALRHVGVEEWMVNVIKSMYDGVTTAVRRNGEESESFEVKGRQGYTKGRYLAQ